MTPNSERLMHIVNELGCKAEAPSIQELLMLLIKEQRRSNDVIQNLAESIVQLANSMIEPMDEEDRPKGDPYAGL